MYNENNGKRNKCHAGIESCRAHQQFDSMNYQPKDWEQFDWIIVSHMLSTQFNLSYRDYRKTDCDSG